jgi:hypothetical protein
MKEDEEVFDFSNQPDKVDWKKYTIDLANPVAPPEPLIIQSDSDIPMLHRRNISTIAASAKVGKTFLVSAIATAALCKDTFLNLHCPKEKVKVLFCDTEMDISDTQAVTKRIHRLNEWGSDKNNDSFIALNLRDPDKETRISTIENAIIEIKPDLVLLDGIVDLVGDFNSIQESHEAVTTLTRWATKYNCHILTCLHVNKGTAELRGHLGAFLRQKGELTLLLSKQEGTFPYIEVKPIDSRHRPIDDFCFRINDEGLPELYCPEPKQPKKGKLSDLFLKILPLPTSMSYADLVSKTVEIANVKVRMAKRKIETALKDGIIIKNDAGFYHLPVKDVDNEEMPF